jgi:hypothetical protein
MLQRWCRVLALIGFIAVLLHSTAPMTEANIDDAGLRLASAKDEMNQMLDAAAQEKLRVFSELNENFKTDMDVVQYQIEQLGKNLHEKERTWIAETTPEKALAKYMKVVAALMQVKDTLSQGKSPFPKQAISRANGANFAMLSISYRLTTKNGGNNSRKPRKRWRKE